MQILLAEEMGMCFGVKDALRALEKVERPDAVTIHGELVHNELVLMQLGARGFRMVGERDAITKPIPRKSSSPPTASANANAPAHRIRKRTHRYDLPPGSQGT